VVNALTDEFHPWQLLADLLSFGERMGELGGLTVAFVGDGASNMGNSWLLAGATAGLHVRIAAPDGHQPDVQYVERAREIGAATGATGKVLTDARMAVTGADVVVTDTWVSMGKEEEKAHRVATFGSYQVTPELMSLAATDAIVLHCLPAYRGKEIDAEVLDGPHSAVWDEAENRRHAQKAIITWLMRETSDLEEVPQ
jgi:ornithine carbamoyltransferase